MKPVVTTVRALRALAIDHAHESASKEALFRHESDLASFILTKNDNVSTQKIILMREGFADNTLIPGHLTAFSHEVLSRVASFAERAKVKPISIPRGWSQYKHNNLFAFFAVAAHDARISRWIVELLPGDESDVVFWRVTTSDNKIDLEDFYVSPERHKVDVDSDWIDAILLAGAFFEQEDAPLAPDVDMFLPPSPFEKSADRSFQGWFSVASPEQRSFIEAPTDRALRLRGPAGSGKTLAITMKAVREALEARKMGEPDARILIVTHSWALATQISDNIDLLGLGALSEIDVFPLLEVARNTMPSQAAFESEFSLLGEDSLTGKRAQLQKISDILADFGQGDWVTFKNRVSSTLYNRFDSGESDDRAALSWDLLIEFGSVIGAAAIFPGAGAEARYHQIQRSNWMLPLSEEADRRLIFHLYERYMNALDTEGLITSDQLLADFLGFLTSHTWNRNRRKLGYDLIFVDEFHLFSPLERQVLHYLTRDISTYPRVFMAIDPRQSPSEAFIGVAADETRSTTENVSDNLADVESFELTTVHRFTPQILDLIKHIHHEFPTLDLGRDWSVDFSKVESAKHDGDIPRLVSSGSRSAEENDIVRAVHDLYPSGRIAIAVVDMRQWSRFGSLAARLGGSGRFSVSSITGRSDLEGVGYRRKGVVVGSAEYLAGLQFNSVIVAGVPDLSRGFSAQHEKTRLLSLLYLAISRAESEVRIFVNDEDGGATEVLARAAAFGLLNSERGSLL